MKLLCTRHTYECLCIIGVNYGTEVATSVFVRDFIYAESMGSS
jgi:hypothetical protein